MTNFHFQPTLKNKVILILALFFLGLCVALVVMVMLVCWHGDTAQVVLGATLTQDVLAFMLPAMACVALCGQRPVHALRLDGKLTWVGVLAVVAVYFLSLPGMNYVIDWNKGMVLPQCLSAVEQWIRQNEDMAAEQTKLLLDQKSLGAFCYTFFVVAIMAGVSEEMFFRGAWQHFIFSPKMRNGVAIWVTAFIFSFIHLQFFGFVPRFLLGAWLGYLLVWSRSLWLPILAHALNNGMVVTAAYLSKRGLLPNIDIDTLGLPGQGEFPWLALGSALATAVAIWLLHRYYKRQREEGRLV